MLRASEYSAKRSSSKQIFAYCNPRSNQVLYSLTQMLEHSALKQLADAGANNNPPKLRKDMWRPLWTVSFEKACDAEAQARRAFEKLREYRKLHELCWQPPTILSQHVTEAEKEEIRRRLEGRGGSKVEAVHDIIKRRKKKIRQRMVMDQKANSIADLAAVLLEHHSYGTEQLETRCRQVEFKTLRSLEKEAQSGALAAVVDQIKQLRQQILKIEGRTRKRATVIKLRKQLVTLRQKKWELTWAVSARAKATKKQLSAVSTKQTQNDVSKDQDQNAVSKNQEQNDASKDQEQNEGTAVEQVVSAESNTSTRAVEGDEKIDRSGQSDASHIKFEDWMRFPKWLRLGNKKLRDLHQQVELSRFSSDGVAIDWAHQPDKGFAKIWPEVVEHRDMAATLRFAPAPGAPRKNEKKEKSRQKAEDVAAQVFDALGEGYVLPQKNPPRQSRRKRIRARFGPA